MELEKLLKLLELDSAKDFEYFEHFAEIIEADYEIPSLVYSELFASVDSEVLSELIENYFEDTLKYIPDDQIDFYNLLTNIGQTLVSLIDTEDFPYEFYKFRTWFRFDSAVICVRKNDCHELEVPIFEALTLYRMENLNSEEYSYDFSEVMDYPLDEYIVPLNSLAEFEEDEEY